MRSDSYRPVKAIDSCRISVDWAIDAFDIRRIDAATAIIGSLDWMESQDYSDEDISHTTRT